jgi:hypothetical protein
MPTRSTGGVQQLRYNARVLGTVHLETVGTSFSIDSTLLFSRLFLFIPLSCLDYKSFNQNSSYFSMDLQPSACLDAMTITVFATNPTNACKFIISFFFLS